MRNKLTLLCIALSTAAMAQTAPTQQAPAPAGQQQGLLSRLRGQSATARQQLQNPSTQIAQPANNQQGYRPGVTFPQQQAQQPQQPQYGQPAPQQQQQQLQQQPQYQQPGWGSQQMPYNLPPGVRPPQQPTAPRPTATPVSRQSSSSDDDDNDSSRSGSNSSSRQSSSRSSDADSGSRSGSSRSSSGSSSSSSKSSSDSEKKSSSSSKSKASDDDDDDKESTSKSSSSSALQKIVKKVESDKSDDDENDEKAEPKKTEEEIAAEKARAEALKAADEATTVVAGFLKQANDGYYSKATEDLAPAIQKYFDSEISAVNGTQKDVLDDLTSNGNITMVTYINTTVRGEGAVVEAELGYEDGRTVRKAFDLVKIEDDWKIVLPVTGNSSADAIAPRKPSEPVAAAATPAPPAVNPGSSLAPPTAEQAASQAPLVLAPNADASATTAAE